MKTLDCNQDSQRGSLHPIVRHSLSRKAGWRMPPNTVKVSRPGRWGNPFLVGPERTQGEAVSAFRIWLTTEGVTAGIPERKQWMLDHLHELRGKNLACWCKPGTPCHADVLIDMANAELCDAAPPAASDNTKTVNGAAFTSANC